MAAMTSKFYYVCVIQYYSDQWSICDRTSGSQRRFQGNNNKSIFPIIFTGYEFWKRIRIIGTILYYISKIGLILKN